jgi:outer membrane protein insertion porin family
VQPAPANPRLQNLPPSTPPSGSRVPSYEAPNQLPARSVHPVPAGPTPGMLSWAGLRVSAIQFEGVSRQTLAPLPSQLPQQPNAPMDPAKVRESLRRLFATGLYKTIVVKGIRHGDQLTLIFSGAPTIFLGRVTVNGIRNDQLNTRVSHAYGLTAGVPISDARIRQADQRLEQALEENGFYLGKVFQRTTLDAANAQMDLDFYVEPGTQARIGDVKVDGDSGMALAKFRKKGKLKANAKVTRDTVSRALTNIRKAYQKSNHLEANLKLESKQFQPPINHLNYAFLANQNAVVKIVVDGVKLSRGKIENLVPVYQEDDIDEDLLNEGNRRIHDYYQREGYFNVTVAHAEVATARQATITYRVHLGRRSEVASVKITGNHYFSSAILLPRLGVHPVSFFERHGIYSEALTTADADGIEALYQSNGFTQVRVTPEANAVVVRKGNKRIGELRVTYAVDEGPQQKFGTYQITGNSKIPVTALRPFLTSEPGQPYSAQGIVNDRDALLTYYLAHGFDHAQINVTQQQDARNPDRIDVNLHVSEGEQTFIRHVLVSGLHYTRASTVNRHILVRAGQPLNQTALLDTQRQLYDLTLFNEVDTAVQNPAGNEPEKNVLIQFSEARRWNITYGFGLQAQTGTPATNCPTAATLIQLGINPSTYGGGCGTNGRFGVSPLVEFDISRINLGGTDQSISLQTKYGTLEQLAELSFNHPHLFNDPRLGYSISGGYSNAQDVTTYAASRLEGNFRVTDHPTRPDTLIYQFTYRRVKVNPNTVQVAPDLIPLLSEPVRIGGPEITWIHDTRRPEPLDAHAGWYNSVQEFVTNDIFASQSNFNRFNWTNSNYYTFGTKKFTLARNTVFGYERAFGESKYEEIPLPERLYAGGAESLRGFGLNDAGPRDSQTGFPIGGAGLFVNQTELRFPNPTLPYVGDALGFVLFHDMGNVFNNSSDIWPSFFRIKQPHSYTCREDNLTVQQQVSRSSSTNTTGTCDFDDFSHSVGLGLRYHTPIGPIRLDFSYNLNPPIYPVEITYSTCTGTSATGTAGAVTNYCPSVQQAPHFNVFFSIGQAF